MLAMEQYCGAAGEVSAAMGAWSGTAIVVVNYGSSALLPLTLGQTADWPSRPDIVVVDNRSTVAEAERVSGLAARHGWTALLHDRNAGFGGGANLGAAAAIDAGADTLVVLNPDAAIAADDLRRVVARSQAQPWSVLSPRVVTATGRTWFDGAVVDLVAGRTLSAGRAGRMGLERTLPWISGACLVTSAELWQALGGFAEEYFLYWEDVDLSVRALRLGAELAVVEGAVAVHDEGGTQPAGATANRAAPWTRSESYYYFNIRNRLLFAARNLTEEQVAQWDATAWSSAYQTLLIGGRRKFLRPAMPIRAAVRGVRDGRAFLAAQSGADGRAA